MQTVSVPWGMWYDNSRYALSFPDRWQVQVCEMAGGADIGDQGIRRALDEPIGAPRLREMARGRRDAAILIDDLTRPTPSYRLLPYILEELAAAGLGDDQVRIICAVAAHRPMIRQDLIKKVGADLVERLAIVNHNAMDNLEFFGHSSQGIPIWVNREFARADLKIAAGMITPRGSIFGGGAKLLLPGACGRNTIFANHSYCPDGVFREHIDEVARMVGLAYIVNPLLNGEGDIMAMVAGDPSKAYWRGVALGKRLYRTPVPEGMDIMVCNAWPKDTEATQAGMGQVPLNSASPDRLSGVKSIVLTAACPEGPGFHSVMGPGTLYRERGILRRAANARNSEPEVQTLVVSPNLNRFDVAAQFGQGTVWCKNWAQALTILEERHGASARVAVFPYGSIQYGGA